MINVNINDPLLKSIGDDMNGGSLYEYNGVLLTGTIQYFYYDTDGNETTNLEGEFSYKDGYKWGLCRSWHENGQLSMERTIGVGVRDGWWREWNENGNLTYEQLWVKGEPQ